MHYFSSEVEMKALERPKDKWWGPKEKVGAKKVFAPELG